MEHAISSIVPESEGIEMKIQIFKRCFCQKRARQKLLNRLQKDRSKLKEGDLYAEDISFEIAVLMCESCKVMVYRDGSWIDELCEKHKKESELL